MTTDDELTVRYQARNLKSGVLKGISVADTVLGRAGAIIDPRRLSLVEENILVHAIRQQQIRVASWAQ